MESRAQDLDAGEDTTPARERRGRTTDALADVARLLSHTLDLSLVAQRIADSVHGLVRTQMSVVYRFDPGSRAMRALAVSGDSPIHSGFLLPADAGIVAVAVRERRPVVTENLLADPRVHLPPDVRATVESGTHRAALAVPLLVQDAVIGALLLGDHLGRTFDDEDLRLAQAFADHASVALENARLYEEAERGRREAEVIAGLAGTINSTFDLAAVLERVAEAARELCRADAARIALRDPASGVMRFRYWRGAQSDRWPSIVIEPGRGTGGQALLTGQPFRTDDYLREPRISRELAELARAEGYHADMVLPIRGADRLEGLLYVSNREPRPFTDADESILRRLADHAAIAIRNVALFAAEQVARASAEALERRSTFLAEASTVLAASLDSEATLTALARIVLPVLGDWSLIDMVDDDERTIRRLALAHVDPAKEALLQELRRFPPGSNPDDPVERVLRTGQAETATDVTEDAMQVFARSPEHLAILRELGIASYMMLPLLARGRTLGVISFVATQPSRSFGPVDLAVGQELARRAALAADNGRLYREAQQASRMKDEFLATLSHELRTPLHAMLGWTQLLRAGRLDERARARALDVIERNTRLQAQLIEDLLDVSRIITGKLRMNVGPVDLVPVVHAAIDAVRSAAEAKEILVETDLDVGIGTVEGDADRLQQVIWNLLSNAIKFTPRGGRVEVRLGAEGAQARLSVSDTGPGIPASSLPFIFERFRQAEGTARTHGGLGLGLAIVRHLVELHGGAVAAENRGEGAGAVFTVMLPIPSNSDPRPAARRGFAGSPPETRLPRLDGLHVLVVDDEPDARDLITAVLHQCGARVTAVASARDALDAIGRGGGDVLVSDIGLPGDNGYVLIREVRALTSERARRLPAIALTAYARPEDRARALDAGYQLHVAKPVEPLTLARALATLMAGHPVGDLEAQ